MIKTSFLPAFTEQGQTVIPLFGSSMASFEKTAAPTLLPEVSRFIESLRPQKEAQYVLVNALGASEWWGANVNADAFPEASLIHRPNEWTGNPLIDRIRAKDWSYGFPTFYYAHAFAHHRNSDPTKALGDIELAAWNNKMKRVELIVRLDQSKCQAHNGIPIWDKLKAGDFAAVSMGSKVPFDTCFPAGTLVRAKRGHVAIEALQVGEEVLTHTGVYRKVTQTLRRDAAGLVRLTPSGLPRIDATENHPFLVLRREQARACKGSANGQRLRHSFRPGEAVCHRCEKTPDFALGWVAADTIRPGDYLAVPATRPRGEVPASLSLARLLGYYLGDGYVIRQRTGKKKDGAYRDMGVGFSVGHTEADHLQTLLGTVVDAGAQNEPCVYEAGAERKAFIVNVYDQELAARLQDLGGRTSHGKQLSAEVFAWPRAAKLELVAGYIDTDGSYDDKRGQVRVASVNRGLLLDVQRLLLQEGIVATVNYAGAGGGYAGSGPSWYLVLAAAEAQRFVGHTYKVAPREVAFSSPQSFFWGGYWLTPVKAVEERGTPIEVFNLSVEADESYVVEGAAVHNCSICLDWKAYRKAQETFDPKKHKSPGEAVLQVHKKLLADGGKGIRGVSITRRDYCPEMRSTPNKIYPDGRKVFVYNDYPRFFDISFVFIGADKTAKTMMKIADGGQNLWNLPGAKLAEALGHAEPGAKTASPLEDLKLAFLGKGAEITKDVLPSQFGPNAVAALTPLEPDLPRDVMDLLAQAPMRSVLSTTAGLGMVLRPREFQRIVIIQMGDRPLADALDNEGAVFPEIEEEEHRRTSMGPGSFSSVLAKLLLPLLAARSGFGPHVERRALMGGRSGKETRGRTSSHSSDLLHKIGAAYRGYRTDMMELVAHAQDLMSAGGSPLSTELHKLSSISVGELFTPLTASYLKLAFWDEAAVKTTAGVERALPSRNTSAQQSRGHKCR